MARIRSFWFQLSFVCALVLHRARALVGLEQGVYRWVWLSDGRHCRVRVLGLFELDGIGPDVPGQYSYTWVDAFGVSKTEEYPLRERLDAWGPPKKPDRPEEEAIGNQGLYDEWLEYKTYEAALAWEQERAKVLEQYLNNVAAHVFEECISVKDRLRIQNVGDYGAIYEAATVKEMTQEAFETALSGPLNATYGDDNVSLLKVYLNLPEKGDIKSAMFRSWELELVNYLGVDNEDDVLKYYMQSIEARALRLASFKRSDIASAIELAKMKAKSGKPNG